MHLGELKDNEGAFKRRMRVGRGCSSGKGKTCGRGQKGQKSRSGVAIKGFEGGQMPIYRRLPKRGFISRSTLRYTVLNLGRLQKAIEEKKIDPTKRIEENTLLSSGVINRIQDGVRLLGDGGIKVKIDIQVKGASKSAIEAVEKAGGKITLITKEQKEDKPVS